MKFLSNKNIINKAKVKRVLCVILKNLSTILPKNIETVENLIVQEDWNVTMIKKDQISEQQKIYYEDNKEIILLQKRN